MNHIAKWDGSSWSALGSGLGGNHSYIFEPNDSAYVSALALDASDNLYVAGNFTTAGGVTAKRIAKWDGASWSALGLGMNGNYFCEVRNLAIDASGNVYAGGHFKRAGLVAANNIAKWDGKRWSAMGFGLNSGPYCLATDSSGNVYAAGSRFRIFGGQPVAKYLARWNGKNWSSMAKGMNGYVSTLAVDASDRLIISEYIKIAPNLTDTYLAIYEEGHGGWRAFGTE